MGNITLSTEAISEIISKHEAKFKFRTEDKETWNDLLHHLNYVPVSYTNESIDYQLIYQQGHGGEWIDISMIIYWDNVPSAVFPFSLSLKEGRYMISSHGLPVLPPLIAENCQKKSRKAITKICLNIVNDIAQFVGVDAWESSESFTNNSSLGEWHLESMQMGALPVLGHELYVDITPEISVIKSRFRRRYKSLISSGTRLWDVGILQDFDTDVWKEFQSLHLEVSGRVTRCGESWNAQLGDIKNGKAFLIYLRNEQRNMVGGGLFNLSRDECVYAVGAYDRTLFDHPLGHVVQYRAIEEMKLRNINWYKIGARRFISESPKPTEKEVSISEFKHGFASHVFPNLRLKHSL